MASHTLEETVGVATLGFFGLVGSFHDFVIIAGERGFVTVGDSFDIL